MQTISIPQQSLAQKVNVFFPKEPGHFSPLSSLYIQTMVFEALKPRIDPDDHISSGDMQRLREVKQFIEQNFLKEHTITSLCRQASLNEFKLKKGFKLLVGTGAIQYVRRLRMEYAQELLRDNRTTVGEVSVLLGYQYPNHFSTAYKRHFGVHPSKRR